MAKVTQLIKTKAPIMELRSHFFPEIHVKANNKVSTEDLDSGEAFDVDYTTDVEVRSNVNDDREYLVLLNVKTDDPEENKAWHIDISAIGQFIFSEDCPEEAREHFAYVTGQSIMYGIIREKVHSLTLEGPFQSAYLPTVTFVPDEDGQEED